MKKNILATFLEKLLSYPLWIKQIIYLKLHQNLSEDLSEGFINTIEGDVFQLCVPSISFAGRTELFERKKGLDNNVYIFLESVDQNLSILEMAMNNFWTTEEVAQYFVFCLEQNYIKPPESIAVRAMANFMAGKYKVGEYFKALGKINVDQLEQAIIRQKQYEKEGAPKKIAEVMIELGYVTSKDTYSLIKLKEESMKRVILDAVAVPLKTEVSTHDLTMTPEEIAKLTEENKLLKDKLNKILAFMKKNA